MNQRPEKQNSPKERTPKHPYVVKLDQRYAAATGRYQVLDFIKGWCPGEDSNLHTLAGAST